MSNNIFKKTVTLILTQDCNLRCIYCYEANKTKQTMSFDTAIRILELELTQEDGTNFVEINLFGGEPFLAFNIIKELVSFLRRKNYSKKWKVTTITNGTLIHNDIQRWIENNKDVFECTLSLDGNKPMQDVNRCNSFDQIDLEFFKSHFPNLPIKMTISQATLSSLCEGTVFLHELGFRVANSFAYGEDWSSSATFQVLENELKKLISYYLSNKTVSPCSLLELPYLEMANFQGKICRNCSAGQDEIRVYDIDGKKYPCHMFTPLSIGDKDVEKIEFPSEYVCSEKLDKKCRSCPIVSFCQHCYGYNYSLSNNIYHVPDDICCINKIVFRAKAKLYSNAWAKKQLVLTEQEELSLLHTLMMLHDF